MRSIIIHTAIVLVALMLISCEGNTTREFQITNSSSERLKTLSDLYINSLPPGDTITIEPGMSKIIGINDTRGGNLDPGSPSDYIKKLFIKNMSGDSLLKDFRTDTNWRIRTIHISRVPSEYIHEFNLTISDEDFQPDL
jgi:hypothetical protein